MEGSLGWTFFGGSKARKSQEKRHGHFLGGFMVDMMILNKGEFYKNLHLPSVQFVPFYPKGLPKGRHFTYLEEPGIMILRVNSNYPP